MRSRLSVPQAVALAAFGLFLATSLPVALGTSANRVLQALRRAGESPEAARVRVFGAPYVETVDTIRRAIPPDGVYALIDGEPVGEGDAAEAGEELGEAQAGGQDEGKAAEGGEQVSGHGVSPTPRGNGSARSAPAAGRSSTR